MRLPGTDMWSINGSESWFRTDHGASTVGILEYGRDGRDQRAHGRDQPSGNDTYCKPTRNEKQLEGLQLALRAIWQFTHIRPGAFILGRQKGKTCYSAALTGIRT